MIISNVSPSECDEHYEYDMHAGKSIARYKVKRSDPVIQGVRTPLDVFDQFFQSIKNASDG